MKNEARFVFIDNTPFPDYENDITVGRVDPIADLTASSSLRPPELNLDHSPGLENKTSRTLPIAWLNRLLIDR